MTGSTLGGRLSGAVRRCGLVAALRLGLSLLIGLQPCVASFAQAKAETVVSDAGSADAPMRTAGRRVATIPASARERTEPAAEVQPTVTSNTIAVAPPVPVLETDPLGDQSQSVYDPVHGVVQAVDPAGAVFATAYDPNGNVTQLTDGRGAVTGYAYDPRNRLTVRTDPVGATDHISSYDAGGYPLTASDRKGQTTTRTFDALNRLATAAYADGATVAFTYDAGNRVTQAVDSAGGTISRAYDLLDRLTSETTAQGTVSYAYDAAGRRTTMTAPGQAQVSYGYDNANRLTSVTQGSAATTIAYDAANRRTALTLPGGVSASYAYDNASELTGVTWSGGGGTLGALAYGYDPAGRMASRGGSLFRSALPGSSSATYDIANRMTAFTSGGVTITPTWDANGALTGDGSRTYAWDARGRLTSISGVAGYVYDPDGRRSTLTPVGGTATVTLYDGKAAVQEQQGGAVSANLFNGGGADEHYTRATTGTGAATSTFLTDALGSTVALAGSGGTIATQYGYDPHGVATATGTANNNPYLFTGGVQDGSGLILLRARYYNPAWRRFISEDPIGLMGGANRYAYGLGDPADLVDPTGLDGGLPPLARAGLGLVGLGLLGLAAAAAAPELLGAGALAAGLEGLGLIGEGGAIAEASALAAEGAPLAEGEVAAAEATAPAAESVGALSGPALGTEAAWTGTITSGAVPEGGMTAYRIYGGASEQVGSWLSPIAPESSAAARSLLSLPPGNAASFISEVNIPAGTQIQFGQAAGAFGNAGGGIQIQLLGRIPTSSFGPGVPLP